MSPPDPTRAPPPLNDPIPVPASGSTAEQKRAADPAGPDPPFRRSAHPGDLGTLGRYRVLKRLGAGGMGAVFLGFDDALRRRLALKVMLPASAAHPSSRHRFLREARSAAAVRSAHVVTIHDVDEDAGVPFIAMEYLQGVPLDRFLAEKPALTVPQAVRIGREVAQGLAAAHALGLIHRDIKPANLWLEAPHGRVKILDFGLAREENEDGTTRTGDVVGTPAYMSPEQARGEHVDARSDLFSLGVVLYRLCTGRQPFAGPTAMAVLTALATTDPPPVRSVNPDVPEPLAALIHRLLSKNAADRPRSADDVSALLASGEAPPPIEGSAAGPQVVCVPIMVTAQQESVWERLDETSTPGAERPARKRAGGWGVWAVAAGALLVALGGGAWVATRNRPEPPPPAPEKPPAKTGDEGKGRGGRKQEDKTQLPEQTPFDPTFFNGMDLIGWQHDPNVWHVDEEGQIVGTNTTGLGQPLLAARPYKDFELSFRVLFPEDDASATRLRLRTPGGDAGRRDVGLMLDMGYNNWFRLMGAMVGEPRRVARFRPAGEFNDVSVRVVGRKVTVTANGLTLPEQEYDIPAEGLVGWSMNPKATDVTIRDVVFKDLSKPSPDPTFFDGKTVAGWEYGSHLWLAAGEIVGQFPRGSGLGYVMKQKTAWTHKAYRDFELSFQVRHANGRGNSGVVFRSQETAKGLPGGRWMWLPQADRLWVGVGDTAVPAEEKQELPRTDPGRAEYKDVIVRCVGKRVSVWVDTVPWRVNEELPDLPDEGVIGFRIDGQAEEVRYRNIRFTDLSRPSGP